jgi:hypothetical protein
MQELHDMLQRDPAAKAIVFSQFVNMLDLLEYRIKRGGIDCVKLSGHMNITARDKVLEVCVYVNTVLTYTITGVYMRLCIVFAVQQSVCAVAVLLGYTLYVLLVFAAVVRIHGGCYHHYSRRERKPVIDDASTHAHTHAYTHLHLHTCKPLQSFRQDPDVKVLLISLKAGGVALNLTVANHIFLMVSCHILHIQCTISHIALHALHILHSSVYEK